MRFSIGEEQGIIRDVYARFFANECPTSLIRKNGDNCYVLDLWRKLLSTGALRLGTEDAQARIVERSLIAREMGRNIAPVPLIETWIVRRCLSYAIDPNSSLLSDEIASGARLVVLAPQRVNAPLNGISCLPGGRYIEGAIIFDGERLAYHDVSSSDALRPNRFGLPAAGLRSLGSRRFDLVLRPGVTAAAAFEMCIKEWKVLSAAALVGLGERALEIGTEYARTRNAFGSPIGRFQAVSHPLANSATALDGAWLLTLEAAWASDHGLTEQYPLASMSFANAATAAGEITRTALHIHGGYGITSEFDIQLFYRRAKSYSLQLGDPSHEWAKLGEWLLRNRNIASQPPWYFPSAQPSDGLDFSIDRKYGPFRNELREFFANTSSETSTVDEATTAASEGFSRGFHEALGAAGLIAMGWPQSLGGRAGDAVEQTLFAEELSYFTGGHNSALATSSLVAKTLIEVGTEPQKQKYLKDIAAGKLIVALGYTEPDGGSDVAAAKTRATRDQGDWIVNGQKMFTTSADFADYVFLLARTDPSAAKHDGLTMFLVPLKSPGVEVRKIETIGGICTTTTFYSDVRVSDEQRVGEINRGWDVLRIALKLEHGSQSYHWLSARLLRAVLSLAEKGCVEADSFYLSAVGRCAAEIEIAKILAYRSAWLQSCVDDSVGERGPMSKLFSSDALVRASSELLDVCAPVVMGGVEGAEAEVFEIGQAFLIAPGTTTYGGTVEMMRSLLAERYLGLPRTR